MPDRHVFAAVLLLIADSAPIEAAQTRAPEIRPEAIAAHVRVLADDSHEGRAPGSSGEAKTVAYITQAFDAAGLSPVADGRFALPVPLVRSTAVGGWLTVGSTRIDNGVDSFVRAPFAGGAVSAMGDAVFVGHGLRTDFAGVDVRDKVVVMFAGAPSYVDAESEDIRAQSTRTAKLEAAAAAGARAAVFIYDVMADDPSWQAVRDIVARETIALDTPQRDLTAVTAVLNREGAARLASAFGTELAALRALAEARPFRALRLGHATLAADNRLQRFESPNVAGVLRGRTRPGEYVVYLAHWDHLGHCAHDGDTICNGAVDNASGVGGLIELARAFGRGKRPDRSVVFLATTAEERGLLGARHFVRSGPIPPQRMVAAFGLDTIAANGPTADVIVLGHGLSGLDTWIADAAERNGRRIVDMPAVQSFYPRSDHHAFAVAGVPAVIATGVFEAGGKFQDYMRDHYHKPSDEPGLPIDYTGAADDVRLILDAGRALANSAEWPAWAKSSSFQRTK
jgi:Zn-dependent M28 family amino/carboxypeptidase